jgi:uncharacterized membrane protein
MRMKLWQIPMTYAAVTTLAGFVVPRLEDRYFPMHHSEISIAAAQTYLGTTASGMMALTGIVFSIAFVMVQFSAVAYSPRLVSLLGRDPGLFHAMGVFIATFLYSLATILWTDRGGSNEVPYYSIRLVLILLFVSMIMFARLVQRLADLQIGNVLQFIGARGRAVIRDLFLPVAGVAIDAEAAAKPDLGPLVQVVRYDDDPRCIAEFDVPALVRLARAAGVVIVLECAVGDTLVKDATVLRVYGGGDTLRAADLLKPLLLAPERTFEQDPKYPLRLLVDIAIRALSPAVNDPTTAVQALDQIEDLLRRLATCRLDAGYAHDQDGVLRVIYPMPTWDDYLSLAFDEIRQFGVTSVQVMRRLRTALVGLAETAGTPGRVAQVVAYLQHLDRVVEASQLDTADRVMARREDRQGLGLSRGEVPAVTDGMFGGGD